MWPTRSFVPAASRRRPQTFDDIVRVRQEVRAVDDRIVHLVAVADIRPSPRNPRVSVDGIAELAASIAQHGLLQPVVVRRIQPSGYELVAGHRRLEAAKTLGWAEISAVVRDDTQEEAYVLTLVENLQREDLSPREEAGALEVLVRERGWSTRQIGEAIKRSPMYVSRRLRVFDDPVVAPLVLNAGLAVSTAEELLRAPDAAVRERLAKKAATEAWSPTTARREVAAAGRNGPLQRTPPPRIASHIRALTDELAGLEPGALSARARRDAVALLDVLARLARPASQ
jgi:ParB family chromosome partitioning protein